MERKLKDRSSPPLPPSCPPLRNISDQTKTHGKIGGCLAEPLNRTQVVEKDDCVGNCGPALMTNPRLEVNEHSDGEVHEILF